MPTYYDKPRMGQTFIRRHNEKSYQYGFVVGLEVNGTFPRDGKVIEEWVATIQYDTTSDVRISARTEIISKSTQWLPVEDDVSLVEKLARAEATIETLQGVVTQLAGQMDMLSEAVANLAAPAAPVTVLTPTAIEETPNVEALRLVEHSFENPAVQAALLNTQTGQVVAAVSEPAVRRRRGSF